MTKFVEVVLPCATLYIGIMTILFTIVSNLEDTAYRLHRLMKWIRYLTISLSFYILLVLLGGWLQTKGGRFFLNHDGPVSVNELAEMMITGILIVIYYQTARAFYELEKVGSRFGRD